MSIIPSSVVANRGEWLGIKPICCLLLTELNDYVSSHPSQIVEIDYIFMHCPINHLRMICFCVILKTDKDEDFHYCI